VRDDEVPEVPETRIDRRTRVAVAGSLLVHLVAAFLFALLFPFLAPLQPHPPPPAEVVTERLELEKKPPPPVPTPKPVPIRVEAPAASTVAPQPVVTTRPETRVVPRPHELAKAVPVAPHTEPHRHLIPVKVAPPAAVEKGKPHLSDEQIAKITSDLGDSIREDRSGIDPLKVPPAEATPSVKHYGHDFSALALGSGAHGLCDPVQSWKADGWNYYYVSCNVQFDDGTFQRQGVPWPIRFAANADPFSGTARRNMPLAMPLPGWHLGPGQSISQQLRDYAHDHGVEL
jgi:hypothetical protein